MIPFFSHNPTHHRYLPEYAQDIESTISVRVFRTPHLQFLRCILLLSFVLSLIFLAALLVIVVLVLLSLSHPQHLRPPVVAIGTKGGSDRLQNLVDDCITIPKSLEMLTPVLATVPLQLFAYHIAKNRGTNIDKPRNLAKSVTVE